MGIHTASVISQYTSRPNYAYIDCAVKCAILEGTLLNAVERVRKILSFNNRNKQHIIPVQFWSNMKEFLAKNTFLKSGFVTFLLMMERSWNNNVCVHEKLKQFIFKILATTCKTLNTLDEYHKNGLVKAVSYSRWEFGRRK